MERLGILISKLQEQYQQHAPAAQMLVTLQMIQQELATVPAPATESRSKISVVLPAGMAMRPIPVPEKEPAPTQEKLVAVDTPPETMPEPPPTSPVIHILDTPDEEIPDPVKEQVPFLNGKQETPLTPSIHEQYQPKPAPIEEFVVEKVQEPAPPIIPPYDPILDVPTLSHQKEVSELNDIIATRVESLNERLRPAHQTELGMMLTEVPVKDLKKAIGINDRFAFINELFRGDESMYERSLKTINNFHIYPEAEYWMERELKIKLGWNEHQPAVKHFYQLVKRRFSSM